MVRLSPAVRDEMMLSITKTAKTSQEILVRTETLSLIQNATMNDIPLYEKKHLLLKNPLQ